MTIAHNQPVRNRNSYLVVIGMDINKYSYFYQPNSYPCIIRLINSVVLSFGGYKKDIFEQPLLSLDIQRVYVIFMEEYHS